MEHLDHPSPHFNDANMASFSSLAPLLSLWGKGFNCSLSMLMVEFSFLRLKTKAMFYHGYDSYLNYAYPYDELKPLSCSGQDTWGR